MNMNQIRYFIALASAKNYTKAAQPLYITLPPLSQQISAIENSLRVVNSKCTNEKNAHYENPFCTGRVFFRAGCHDYESASVSFHGPCVVDSEELIHCRNDSLLVFLAF